MYKFLPCKYVHLRLLNFCWWVQSRTLQTSDFAWGVLHSAGEWKLLQRHSHCLTEPASICHWSQVHTSITAMHDCVFPFTGDEETIPSGITLLVKIVPHNANKNLYSWCLTTLKNILTTLSWLLVCTDPNLWSRCWALSSHLLLASTFIGSTTLRKGMIADMHWHICDKSPLKLWML